MAKARRPASARGRTSPSTRRPGADTKRRARASDEAPTKAGPSPAKRKTKKRATPKRTAGASKAGAKTAPRRAPSRSAGRAAAAAAQLTRTCENCGKRLRLPTKYLGMAVPCPGCKAEVAPTAAELHGREEDGVNRDQLVATGGGYAISVGVHVVFLAIAASITWYVGREEKKKEIEAVVVAPEQEKPMDTLQTQMDELDAPPSEIRDPNDNPREVTPVRTVTSNLRSPAEALVGIELAAGSNAPQGDWMAFGTGTGRGGGSGAGFFGLEARGQDFVYVIDCSSSMYGKRLAAAKAEVIRSLNSFNKNMRFHIIFYNTRAMGMSGGKLLKANATNKHNTFAWLDTVYAGGKTNPVQALQNALRLEPDAVWLLTDGEFEDNDAVRQAIAEANPGQSVQIHTIAFASDEGERVLKAIAEDNRGEYRFVPVGGK